MFSSRSNRGLTLIEVVISLSILVFMGAMTWQTIAGSLMLRDILEYEDSVSRSTMQWIKSKRNCRIPDFKCGRRQHLPNSIIGKDGGDETAVVQSSTYRRICRCSRRYWRMDIVVRKDP